MNTREGDTRDLVREWRTLPATLVGAWRVEGIHLHGRSSVTGDKPSYLGRQACTRAASDRRCERDRDSPAQLRRRAGSELFSFLMGHSWACGGLERSRRRGTRWRAPRERKALRAPPSGCRVGGVRVRVYAVRCEGVCACVTCPSQGACVLLAACPLDGVGPRSFLGVVRGYLVARVLLSRVCWADARR